MKQFNYRFAVPEQKRVRMLISTDAKNEADDQFAIAHHLMTPKFDVRGIIPAHFETPFRSTGTSCQASLDEVHLLLKLMDLEGVCPVEKARTALCRMSGPPWIPPAPGSSSGKPCGTTPAPCTLPARER